MLGIALWIGCITFMVEDNAGFPEGSWAYELNLQDASVGRQFSWCYWKVLRCAKGGPFNFTKQSDLMNVHETNRPSHAQGLGHVDHARARWTHLV